MVASCSVRQRRREVPATLYWAAIAALSNQTQKKEVKLGERVVSFDRN